MLTRVLTNSFTTRSIHLIRDLSSQQLNFNSEVTQKYGRDVPVEVPRFKDVIQFPVTPFHHDYENAWRRLTVWASDYLERQEDLKVIASWDPAYSMGWQFPHFDSDAYLALNKIYLSAIYNDWLYDTRWSAKDKLKAGREFMSRLTEKKYPKDARFIRNVEMVIDAYRGLKKWLTEEQDKQCKAMTSRFLVAELLTPNKVDHQTDLDKYIKHRSDTYASELLLKFQEAVFGFELSDEIKKHSDVNMILDACNQLMWLPNDLLSFKYEQANDDHWNNFVTVYARQNNVPLQNGINKLIDYQGWE